MAEREQILADFQACTGNENIEECIVILEQHDWNLMQAVQNAMSGLDSPHTGSPPRDISPPNGVNPPTYVDAVGGLGLQDCFGQSGQGQGPLLGDPGGFRPHESAENAASRIAANLIGADSAIASCSRAPYQRLLNFKIEHGDRNVQLSLPDSETVGRIKQLLESDLGIPASKQDLRGWVNKNNKPIEDSDVLRDLHLPLNTTLFLLSPVAPSTSADTDHDSQTESSSQRFEQMYSLLVQFKNDQKVFSLNFPGKKTIQEVKADVYSLTDVPVRHQVWEGWPASTSDSTLLCDAGLQLPSHNLLLWSRQPSNKVNFDHEEAAEVDSGDDFEDAHDNFVLEDFDTPGTRRPEPLMAEDAANQTEALESFSREFCSRYGDCHPVFYIGDLENAIQDSLLTKAKDRKLLAIYLHHDASIQANVFCSQILCTESVVTFLSNNFITWGWDLTSHTNRARLLTMCTRHFGSIATNTVQNLHPDELPLLLIISRNRGANEVMQAIHGNTSLDELMTHLVQVVEVFKEQQLAEIREEEERMAREQMLAEQDAAYQESLAADRAKAEVRRREEEEQRQKELEEQMMREAQERERQEEAAQKEAIRQSLSDQLPEEPPANCSEAVSTLRLRCPSGETVVRRFLGQHPLQVLLNFVASKGFPCSEFKVLTTFPRKDLTLEDPTKTLQELKLCPQETLILEEK